MQRVQNMSKNLQKAIFKANKSKWDKTRAQKIIKEGLYEVWYTMVDDIEREEAYWIRYTMMCPKSNAKREKDQDLNDFIDSLGGDGMLWAGFFDAKDPSKNFIAKHRFLLSEVEGSRITNNKEYLVAKIKDAFIYLDGLKGGFETESGRKISWDLKFSHFMEPYITTPDIAKSLGFTNTLVKASHPNIRISGNMTIDGESKDLKSVPGIQYHTYGDGYEIPWEWLSCHTFTDSPDAYLDLGYKINKGTLEFFDGEKSMTSWNKKITDKFKVMKKITREKTLTSLSFHLDYKNISFQGEIAVPMENLLAVEYQGPQGNSFFCYNSEIAGCKLLLSIKNPDGSIKERKEYVAEKSVSFETVYDNPQEGVKYLPWEREEL